MKILALEFSADLRSAAVLGGAGTPACVCETVPRECAPIQLVDRVLRQASMAREAVDTIAIGLGPGSYTGIRTAIAMAQGWRLARPVRLMGVSSIEVLATDAHNAGMRGNVSVVVDAQRGEIYWARYALNVAGAELVQPLRLATWADLEPSTRAGDTVVGPHAAFVDRGVKLVTPTASTLATLASVRQDDVAPGALEPIYLRTTTFVKAPPRRQIPPAGQITTG
jgi:tRNA threonylcarbamoyladenosine biosynthesis protein TsaB